MKKSMFFVLGMMALTNTATFAEEAVTPPKCDPIQCQKDCYMPFLEKAGMAIGKPGPVEALQDLINTAKTCITEHKGCTPSDCKL